MYAPNSFRVFRLPVLLAIATAVGLLSALLGDGFWDWLSWLALSAPVAVIAWHLAPLSTVGD